MTDSVDDLREWIRDVSGITLTNRREDALFVVQVMSREEVDGEYRVHVRVTTDGHEGDLTGTSMHQWKLCVKPILVRIANWAKAHPADLKKRRDRANSAMADRAVAA